VVVSAGAWFGLRPSDRATQTHTYYIAADAVVWDYAPSGMDETTGEPLGEAQAFWIERGPHKIGKVYKKALYREYTDSTFSTLKPRPPEWEHLGMVHAPHWHGNTVAINRMRTDVAQLLTMGMLIADMVPDNPGTWLFHCHVAPHLAGGMTSVYTVAPAGEALTRR